MIMMKLIYRFQLFKKFERLAYLWLCVWPVAIVLLLPLWPKIDQKKSNDRIKSKSVFLLFVNLSVNINLILFSLHLSYFNLNLIGSFAPVTKYHHHQQQQRVSHKSQYLDLLAIWSKCMYFVRHLINIFSFYFILSSVS